MSLLQPFKAYQLVHRPVPSRREKSASSLRRQRQEGPPESLYARVSWTAWLVNVCVLGRRRVLSETV
jgi:hypothetical protein